MGGVGSRLRKGQSALLCSGGAQSLLVRKGRREAAEDRKAILKGNVSTVLIKKIRSTVSVEALIPSVHMTRLLEARRVPDRLGVYISNNRGRIRHRFYRRPRKSDTHKPLSAATALPHGGPSRGEKNRLLWKNCGGLSKKRLRIICWEYLTGVIALHRRSTTRPWQHQLRGRGKPGGLLRI